MSLKVFDLQCGNGHVFEGWFSPSNSFEAQASQGLLTCPVCSDDMIKRKLSAPRLNLGKGVDANTDMSERSEPAGNQAKPDAAGGSAQLAEIQGNLLRHMRKLVKNSEDVGGRFAQEAMKIHHGEAEDRVIRGTATADERRELLDEGIAVLPVPDFLSDEQLQ